MKKNLAVFAALVVGMMLGAASMAAYYGPIAEIVAEVVPAPGGSQDSGGGPANLTGTISLHVGQLVVGQHYSFDDVEGYTWLDTGSGGSFDIVLSYNMSAFDYVRVKIEIETYEDDHDSSSSEVEYEFYLDTNNPSYTVGLPAGQKVKIMVELEEITVSANASPGSYVIAVDLFGP